MFLLSSSLISLLFLFTSPYCIHLTLLQLRLLFLFLFSSRLFSSYLFTSSLSHFFLLQTAMRFLVHPITSTVCGGREVTWCCARFALVCVVE
jgi:hypothetical protein